MLETNRGHSFVAYSYDGGGPLSFVLPFPYLEKSHIRAFIGEGESAAPVAFAWVSSNTVSIPTPAVPPPFTVTLRRVTPIDEAIVDFRDGARLPAADLNRSALQLLYTLQEQRDFGVEGSPGYAGGAAASPLPGGVTPSWSVEYLATQVLNSTALQQLIETNSEYALLHEVVLEEVARSAELFNTQNFLSGRLAAAETSLETVVANDTARASEITQLAAALADETSAREAGFGQLNTAIVNGDAALASSITGLTATVNGNQASVQQRFVALAEGGSDPGGEWTALYSLKLTGQTAGGVPVVAGIGLGINPATGSEFVVSADRFAIVNPNYTGAGGDKTPKVPFVVGQVNGVSTVGIAGQLVVDGSITATKMSVGSLSAISANMGTVNGGTFKTHSLDANGNILDPTEFRVEITNAAGDFPLWIGAGTKTANNAVFYVTEAGAAKFAGEVSAPNIVGQLQAATILNRLPTPEGANVPPNTLTTVDSWTFPAPIRPGEEHGIIGTITVKLGTLTEPTVILEYLNGSVWTELSRAETGDVTGSADAFVITNSLTLSFALPPRGTATDFRLRLTYRSQKTVQARYKGTTGFIMGVR